MKKFISVLALLALPLTAATLHADDSAIARAQLRQNLTSFWGVAEEKVRVETATAANRSSDPVAMVSPAERASILNERYQTSRRDTVVVHAAPQKTVQAQQQTHHSKDEKKFGLTLFGGIKLFQFHWGDESSSETDSLTGNL